MRKISVLGIVLALACTSIAADARSLENVRERGVLGVCAHPNALPFSSKTGDLAGFQVELARAIADKLGVTLQPDWVVMTFQIRAADCDIMMDTIDDKEAQGETNLKLSRPYYRTGAALVVAENSPITSLAALDAHTKVGVLVGSMAAMTLGERHVGISIFGFEDDALDAVANHEVDAAMVTPTMAGYYNLRHPDHKLRVLALDETDPGLAWNVSVGMVRPDPALRAAIDDAIAALLADGTVARIYARYGVVLLPPR
jgi:polar amino acid transport system substrate-binding protein|uniref:Transporter substrate-binding domain-containing protein n=1 Tax=Acidicaldus sp. TaxID=1872105 RepID=A0A8J4HBD8_9PROT